MCGVWDCGRYGELKESYRDLYPGVGMWESSSLEPAANKFLFLLPEELEL